MTTHLAAVSSAKGTPFELQTRATPKPGPDELLIVVKSIALNPADGIMRDKGLFIPTYPTVIGFDFAGLVLEAGNNVPVAFQPSTRIAAYAAAVWKSCDPDYGAFQERCLIPWQHALCLPEGVSWHQAATLPVAGQVPLSAWDMMGIQRVGGATISSPRKREALLIWGASSSVGTMGVQTARLLRDDPGSSIAAVYATAGAANHEYVGSLGADHVFDYKEPQVVDAIISAAKYDGLVIRHCFLATGQLAPCQAVLKAFVGDDRNATIGSAPVVPPDTEEVDGVEVIFLMPSMDEGERLAQFEYWMRMLRENLVGGAISPSPEPKIVGKGLGAINAGLDVLQRGVSCTKLVIEME
ncbi:zinc-binding alcohol dehydrogenase family protein [Aspergillus ibericus CBS 121593]|uniref:GroES-like protein n=1 Tax=Aspergillus ibericus CBS 121593 TaxID=1448316 RepID=A0A395GJ78_9EURO|nr:GroES-like protein [Aspergillus ibericus CBS 121593]RAK95540.1 GroES-like protein [Aspergillus ibericus CBS 121593]